MVVNGEARGEPLYGQVAVAMVVENRAHAEHVSVCAVSRQHAQFVRKARPGQSCAYAAFIAQELYHYLPRILRDNWYFNTQDVNPKYGRYNQTIGHHKFYTRQ